MLLQIYVAGINKEPSTPHNIGRLTAPREDYVVSKASL